MPGKLSLPEQVKKEALIGTAFSWLSEQKDEVLELLLALREQPIPNEKLKKSLVLPATDRSLAQIIFFSGKPHCALTEVGEAVLKKVEGVIQQYKRITNPSGISEEALSKEKENDVRFRNRLEQFSAGQWEALLSRLTDGNFTKTTILWSENTLLFLSQEGLLSRTMTQSDPELPPNVAIYTLTDFGKYCAERYIQHVYGCYKLPDIAYKTLSRFGESKAGSVLHSYESFTEQTLDAFGLLNMVEKIKQPTTGTKDSVERFVLTCLGAECLKLWKEDQQNDTGRNPETC